MVELSAVGAGREVCNIRWYANGVGGSTVLGGGLIVARLSTSSCVLILVELGRREVLLFLVLKGAVAGKIRGTSLYPPALELGRGAVPGSKIVVIASYSRVRVSMGE